MGSDDQTEPSAASVPPPLWHDQPTSPPVSMWSPPSVGRSLVTVPDQTAPVVKARTRKGFILVLAVAVAAWSSGLLGAFVGVKLANRSDAPARQPSTLGIDVAPVRDTPLPLLDVPTVAAAVGVSVVAVQHQVEQSGEVVGESIGTGLIVTSDGEIITNAHVVGDAKTVNVRLVGESEPRQAAVVASDPAADLALLRIDATGLVPATLATPDDVRLGDQVMAIGYALDLDGDPSVTVGIISALGRALETETGVLSGLIQTDAAISSGNSGGPLVNALGQVVGINTLVVTAQSGATSNGLGFAISSGTVQAAIGALRDQANGQVQPAGFLGVNLVARHDGGSGALVSEVVVGSPADDAGIEVDDVVIAVDEQVVDGQVSLVGAIRGRKPGDSVSVTLVRGGQQLTVDAVLTVRPPD